MNATYKNSLAFLHGCLFLATFVAAGVATISAIAQVQKAQSDDDDSPGIGNDRYAKMLIDDLDKNDNKVLDGDELAKLKEPARSADFNKDGFISREELVARLSNPASKPSRPASMTPTKSGSESSKESSDQEGNDDKDEGKGQDSERLQPRRGGKGRGSDGDRSDGNSKIAPTPKRVLTWTGGGGKAGEVEKDKRRTYRFTPASEKLPTGLPSWFKSQDKNGDGQVAMSEYSRSWSKSTVAKFRGYDLNDDGVITAKEAAK